MNGWRRRGRSEWSIRVGQVKCLALHARRDTLYAYQKCRHRRRRRYKYSTGSDPATVQPAITKHVRIQLDPLQNFLFNFFFFLFDCKPWRTREIWFNSWICNWRKRATCFRCPIFKSPHLHAKSIGRTSCQFARFRFGELHWPLNAIISMGRLDHCSQANERFACVWQANLLHRPHPNYATSASRQVAILQLASKLINERINDDDMLISGGCTTSGNDLFGW